MFTSVVIATDFLNSSYNWRSSLYIIHCLLAIVPFLSSVFYPFYLRSAVGRSTRRFCSLYGWYHCPSTFKLPQWLLITQQVEPESKQPLSRLVLRLLQPNLVWKVAGCEIPQILTLCTSTWKTTACGILSLSIKDKLSLFSQFVRMS